jgi:hypothetical protein
VSIRASSPPGVKRLARKAIRRVGQPTAGLRLLPGLVLAGASRCGTTSLHRALVTHPALRPPVAQKGVHYFDVSYGRGLSWYRGHFPVRAVAAARSGAGGPLGFESSGYYMHHPLAPARMAADLPGVRGVVMLRDPVERAYSAFKHESARGFETAPTFETALDLEAGRLEGEVERIRTTPGYVSHAHRHQSYVDRGQYVEQVTHLFDTFGRDRVHVMFSEDFFATPHQEYERLLAFLDLPVVHPPAYEQHNARRASPMAPETRERLDTHFKPYDDALAELLGRPVAWRP